MDFNITRVQEQDYKNIAEFLAEVRGHDYYDKGIFSPEYLKENSIFAVFGKDGKAIAVISAANGLFGSDFNYLCMLAVKKECTGNGLATKLLRYIIEYLRKLDSSCMKAHIVTDFNIVQKMAEKEKFLPVGFLFAVRDNKKASLNETLYSDKRTLIVYARTNAKIDCGKLFIHKSINNFTEKVYKNLNVMFTLSNNGVTANKTTIKTFFDKNHNVIYIKALECGTDISEKLTSVITEHKKTALFTAVLLININSPSAIFGYIEAKKSGFQFSGFEPLDRDYEYLLMFNKYKVNINTDEIKTTDKSNSLLKDILDIENNNLF